ncbi:hypothetical protein ACIG0D_22265 [Streptomyces sp. NPDC052773]|uniref:hypothetical protein n=1 Tax=Streptomyces sp. NPDC052773 TaxID=3365693 RepID=UPI0037D646CF
MSAQAQRLVVGMPAHHHNADGALPALAGGLLSAVAGTAAVPDSASWSLNGAGPQWRRTAVDGTHEESAC